MMKGLKPILKETYQIQVYIDIIFKDDNVHDELWTREFTRTEKEGFLSRPHIYQGEGSLEHQMVLEALEGYVEKNNPGSWKRDRKGGFYHVTPNKKIRATLYKKRMVSPYPEYDEIITSG